MNPSSSARVANTKSVAWTGRKSPCVWVPFVRPLPTSPPDPTAIWAWWSWKPAPWMSGAALKKASRRAFW